ncbi:flagellar basal body-associated FliL family protein [bacterium]|nr:flagellar basal body-associated FliL family protein [bacterium]
MKFLLTIENLLNAWVTTLSSAISKSIVKITPKKLKTKVNTQNKKISKKTNRINRALTLYSDSTVKFLETNTNAIKKTCVKETAKVLLVAEKVGKYDYKSVDSTKIKIFILTLIAPLFSKLQKWILSLKPTTIGAVIITSTIASVSGIQIYKNTEEISEAGKVEVKREIASLDSGRSEYSKSQEKQLRIRNIALPIYIESKNNKRPIKVDITLETSNRYTRKYFYDNFEFIHDYLNTQLLPTIPKFILEAEGKAVLKEKIRTELNKLIKERGIKGEIKEVHFHHLLAS